MQNGAKLEDVTVAPSLKADSKSDTRNRIGRFEIIKQLGEGGFATVFLARDPKLQRQVALKVPKADSLSSPEAKVRFEREARAAALLNHPAIVPVFETGATHEISYIASAYCPGQSLADWIASQSQEIDIRHAVEIVAELAEAVHHAHQRGIIHRDLKPANILVDRSVAQFDHDQREEVIAKQTQVDPTRAAMLATRPGAESETIRPGRPTSIDADTQANAPDTTRAEIEPGTFKAVAPSVPHRDDTATKNSRMNPESISHMLRITDFGLAKSRQDVDLDLTIEGSIMGTPSYMSPEQAKGQADVGEASDIFSLGTIFFELLTGKIPFKRESAIQTLRSILEDPLPPLSRFRGNVPKDICAVVEKSMKKAPVDRYRNAFEFAQDLRRWLEGRSVSVRQTTSLEKTIRWCRRNPAHAGTVAFAMCSLLMGIALVSWKWKESNANLKIAQKEFQRAEVALEELKVSEALAVQESQKAIKAAEQEAVARKGAERVSNFMVEAFRKPDPEADGLEIRVVDILNEAAVKLDDSFPDDHTTRLKLQIAIGKSYLGLGQLKDAKTMLEEALQDCHDLLPDDRDLAMLASSGLAELHLTLDDHDKAEALFLEVATYCQEKFGSHDGETISAQQSIAVCYLHQDRYQEVIDLLAEIDYGPNPDDHYILSSENLLANAYAKTGKLKEASESLSVVLEKRKRQFGDEHPRTTITANNLAVMYKNLGEVQKAIKLQEEVLEIERRVQGEDHPSTLRSMNNLATSYQIANRHLDAVKLLEPLYDFAFDKLGENNVNTLSICHSLGRSYKQLNRLEAAKMQFQICQEPLVARLGKSHDRALTILVEFADTLFALEEWESAELKFTEAIEAVEAKHGKITVDGLVANIDRALARLEIVRTRGGQFNDLEEVLPQRERFDETQLDENLIELVVSAQLVSAAFFAIEDESQQLRDTLGKLNVAVLDKLVVEPNRQPAHAARILLANIEQPENQSDIPNLKKLRQLAANFEVSGH